MSLYIFTIIILHFLFGFSVSFFVFSLIYDLIILGSVDKMNNNNHFIPFNFLFGPIIQFELWPDISSIIRKCGCTQCNKPEVFGLWQWTMVILLYDLHQHIEELLTSHHMISVHWVFQKNQVAFTDFFFFLFFFFATRGRRTPQTAERHTALKEYH